MTKKFDYEETLADLKASKPITCKDSVLRPSKQIIAERTPCQSLITNP
jgi:hypothetical protein